MRGKRNQDEQPIQLFTFDKILDNLILLSEPLID